jgi:PAS domain S-box-containing protein
MRTSSEETEIERLRAEVRHLRRLLNGREQNSEALVRTEPNIALQNRELISTREELEQKARLFDTVLSSIVDFAYTFDREGRFTYVNQALLDLWQMRLEEARGKTFFQLPYPHSLAARLHEQIQTVFRTGQMLRDETPYTGAAGTTGYYEYIFSPVFNPDGQVTAVAGSTRDITERVQAQAEKEALFTALQVERERLTTLFMQAPAFIAVVRGPEHIFEMANPLYLQLVGYRELLGRPVRQAFPEIEGQGFFEILDEVYRTGQAFIGKAMPIRFRAGADAPVRERFIDFVYQPLIEADGSVSGIFVHGVDLTERVAAEKALQASEERVRLATEAAELGIWVWEPATDKVIWENDRMYAIYGLSPLDEPLTSTQFVNEIVHPDDARAFASAIAAPVETGEPLYFEGRFRRKDGSRRWIEFRGRLQQTANGEPLCVAGTAADITERKRAEEQERQAARDARVAAEANAKFRTFFDQGSYFAGVMTLDGTLIEVNRLCLDASGYTREEVIGKKFWDCGWWNRSAELRAMIEAGTQEAARGNVFRRESHYFLADGTRRFLDLILAPVKDEAGRVLFIAPTGTDITERNEAERILRERAGEIEGLNRRLTRSMKETHHRVKNNLQVISAMIEMQVLEHQGEGTVPLEEFVRLKAHVHTLAIVHDLLTASIKENEDAQRVSTRAVLEKLLPMLQQTAWKQSVGYSVDEVQLTSKQCIALSLVLNELVSNALKHGNQQADVFFTVEGESATLAVYDDGAGFPEGFDPKMAANTGLELVGSLVRTDLRGTIQYGNQTQGGGQVIVTFPLPTSEE